MSTVYTRMIKIGNSHGIRIPKPLLEQASLTEQVELEVVPGGLMIRPAHAPRQSWDVAFQEMAQQGEDALLDNDNLPPTDFDRGEWTW